MSTQLDDEIRFRAPKGLKKILIKLAGPRMKYQTYTRNIVLDRVEEEEAKAQKKEKRETASA